MMPAPTNIQTIGNEIAILWDDGQESYFDFEALRAASPSAANQGERDILGNQYGGDGPKQFKGVQVVGCRGQDRESGRAVLRTLIDHILAQGVEA